MFTTALAATTAPRPTVTPARIVDPAPIQTSSPIPTDARVSPLEPDGVRVVEDVVLSEDPHVRAEQDTRADRQPAPAMQKLAGAHSGVFVDLDADAHAPHYTGADESRTTIDRHPVGQTDPSLRQGIEVDGATDPHVPADE